MGFDIEDTVKQLYFTDEDSATESNLAPRFIRRRRADSKSALRELALDRAGALGRRHTFEVSLFRFYEIRQIA